MDKDLVSIIMPAYNAGRFIEESIQSVINQTYKNWELIIIDDGSVDNTAVIIDEYQKTDLRIRYLHQQNAKQGKARNYGLKNSKGRYIAFLDADDKWTPNKLAIQIKTLSDDDSIDLLFSQGYMFTNDKVEDMDTWVKDVWDYHDFQHFIDGNKIPILSVIVKRTALLQVGEFTEKDKLQNVEDYHLWLKLLITNHRFKSIADRLFYYRIHNSQVTYENKNLTNLCFNVYEDIYYWTNTQKAKQLLISKLKWFIFIDEYFTRCMALFEFHFKKTGLKFPAFMIANIFNKPSVFHKKMAFKLVSIFA